MKFSPLLLVQYDCSALEPAKRAEVEEQLREFKIMCARQCRSDYAA